VFTPADAPQVKLAAIARHGAELRADSRDYDEAERRAKAFAGETGAQFISPYSDADVIAGAATVRARDLRGRRGHRPARRSHRWRGADQRRGHCRQGRQRRCAVVGVEVEVSCAFLTSVRAGKLVEIVPGASLADGLGGNPDPDTITFEPIQRLVDQIVTVSEKGSGRCARRAGHRPTMSSRRAPAPPPRRPSSGKRVEVPGRRVAVMVSGANIDRARLAA
jgi:threonine dehydratase